MKPLLVHVQPRAGPAGARTDVRLHTGLSGSVGGIGFRWEAAIVRRPRLAIELFNPTLNGSTQLGRGDLVINLNNIRSVADVWKLYWPGAPITIYDATNLDQPAVAPIEFKGVVRQAQLDLENAGQLSLAIEVTAQSLDKLLLFNEFSGAGGINGSAEMRGKLKPAGFGSVKNVEIIWFDTTNNIGMVDGYGNTVSINSLFEGASDFGAKVADYADYATLVARIADKTVAPGRWATCVAQGLVGVGAPPFAPMTADCVFGTNRPGAFMRRLMETHAGILVADIDTAAYTALDASVNRAVHYWTSEQRDIKDLIEAIAASCNASPLVTFQGKYSVTRVFGGATIATINRQAPTAGRRVTKWRALDPEPPTWRMKMRAERPGVTLSTDQILYEDDLIDMGQWVFSETYRQGHLVWNQAGAQFLYINAVPSANQALPVLPATSNAFWQRTKAPPAAGDLFYADGTSIEALRPEEAGANVTEANVAAAIAGQGPFATVQTPISSIWSPPGNLLRNGGFSLRLNFWSAFSGTGTGFNWAQGAVEGPYVLNASGGTKTFWSDPFPVTAGQTYGLQAELFTALTAGTVEADVFWYQDANGTVPTASGSDGAGVARSGNTANWVRMLSAALVAPAGAVRARVRIFIIGATGTAGWRRIKFNHGNVDSPFSDETTLGRAIYESTGQPVDVLMPSEAGANVTGTNTAAAIVGQGAWATDPRSPNLVFSGSQNLVVNGGMTLGVFAWTWGSAGWSVPTDQPGKYLQPPLGAAGTYVRAIDPALSFRVPNGQAVNLSAELTAQLSAGQTAFVDIRWTNAGNGAEIGYSSNAPFGTNTVSWNNTNPVQNRKNVALVAPNATDGSGAVFGQARLVVISDVAMVHAEVMFAKVKVELGGNATPFTDEATDQTMTFTMAGGYRTIADGRNYQTNRNFGLQYIFQIPTITDTQVSTTVTINIGASSYLADWGATISLPSGSIAGLAFSTLYYIYRVQPDPTTAGTSYGASTVLADALAPGRSYIGFWTTRASGGGGGSGGWGGNQNCVSAASFVLVDDQPMMAWLVGSGDRLTVLDEETMAGVTKEECALNDLAMNECVTLETESGIRLTVAMNTPITLRDGGVTRAAIARGVEVPVLDENGFRWETVTGLRAIGQRKVARIRANEKTYAAGDEPGRYILTHNQTVYK